jgi:hypothetical protein
MESNVFNDQSGVNPKKIPMAEPSAIECGVSAIVINVMWCEDSQRLSRAKGPGRFGPNCFSVSCTATPHCT